MFYVFILYMEILYIPCSTSGAQVLTCPEHDQEKLHFYCRSCQRLLCPLCKLRRVHSGHKILPVAHAYQALKVRVAPRTEGLGSFKRAQNAHNSVVTCFPLESHKNI